MEKEENAVMKTGEEMMEEEEGKGEKGMEAEDDEMVKEEEDAEREAEE